MSKEITTIPLGTEIKQLIEQSRQNVAVTVNAELTMLYWNVGKRINEDILKNNRAEYGKEIVNALSSQLTAEYGKGWGEKQLRHCIRFAETFPDEAIVSALRRQLTWTHIRAVGYTRTAPMRKICNLLLFTKDFQSF